MCEEYEIVSTTLQMKLEEAITICIEETMKWFQGRARRNTPSYGATSKIPRSETTSKVPRPGTTSELPSSEMTRKMIMPWMTSKLPMPKWGQRWLNGQWLMGCEDKGLRELNIIPHGDH